MHYKHILTIWMVILSLNISMAQLTPKMTDVGTGYLELLPPDYSTNPTKKYPLMIFLHGKGERGSGSPADLERVKRHGPTLEASRGHDMCFMVNGQQECFILIAPQLPGSRNGWGTNFIDPVFDYVLNGPENYRIDLNRVYLTGLSLGGGGVYRYAPSAPNDPTQIAAISAIAGWGRTVDGCVISERKIAMWSFHGDQDRTVGYGSGIAMYNAVNNCTTPVPTAEVRFTTYEGVGHNSWSRAYRTDNSLHTPNLYEWLLMQSLSGNPTANAGPDQSITLPTNSITLNGSGSDDGSVTAYSWAKTGGPAATLSNASTPNLALSNLVEGVYTFTLTVTDNDGNTASDDAEVVVISNVVNTPPTVNAGSNFSITLPTNSTNITATASDSDGSIASYQWTQRNGPSSATLASASSATVTISNLVEGTYRFRATVTDDRGATAFDNIDVTVNPAAVNSPPTADAGNNVTLNLPTNSTTLSGSGTDTDGSIASYLWEKVSGPTATLSNANTPTLIASSLVEGVYDFRLTVTDDEGATGSDNATVTVVNTNQNPTANAGTDITVTLPTNNATLNGSGSDPDGSINSYSWSQISGPGTATVANSNNAVTGVSGLIEGVYQIELTVTDDDGATDTDIVRITVNAAATNAPPVANAGNDISITLPTNSIVINGSATDPDGTVVAYLWEKVSGPASLTLINANTASVTAGDLVAGTYVFRLTVTDDDGATDTNKMNLSVAPEEVNQTPTVDAGADGSITLPNSQITLNGTASDADGTIASYLWTQESGPGTATLSGQATADLTASNLIEGDYIFKLSVTDDDGASASDNVQVTVFAVNQPPVVSAGPDVNLVLPTNSVTLNGTAIDSDGLIINTSWIQIAGPVVNSSIAGNDITITDLTENIYTFQFLAVDNQGANSSDEVSVTVTASNMVPVVDAGPDRNLILPNNSLNITGTASDPDGTIASYSWSKISGNTATLTNQNTATVTISDLEAGAYIFSVTAEDDDGDSASDEVEVIVAPAMTNAAPTANAGNNINITLPTNSVNITGTGSDSDGSIASYQWVKTSGPAVNIANGNTPTMTANNLVEGTYIFALTVTDDDGATDTDNMQLVVNPEIVNQSPVANAGPDIQLFLPTNSTNILGGGSDPDGSINQYQWNLISGPSTPTISDNTLPTLTVSNLIEGIYDFEIVVTDDDGASSSDNMLLTVSPAAANSLPVANAGPDQILTLPTKSTNVMGSGSDADGAITAYQWTKTSGPSASLFQANSPTLSVDNLVEGTYNFQLTVTDDDGDTGSDDMTIQVLPEVVNSAPIANAGVDITLILPVNSTQAIGSTSDNDGTVVSRLWTKIQGGNATLGNINGDTLGISDLEEGIYTFRLTATDDDGADGSDEVNVTVLPNNSNTPPVVLAGDDQTIFLPVNTAQLMGNSSDNGSISTRLWEKVSGPSVTLVNADRDNATVSDLVEGTYIFRLTATDDEGASSSDQMTLTVLPETTNQPPTANAGIDIFIDQPENSATINGSANDADGTITLYQWSFIEGPTTPTISGTDSEVLTVNGLTDIGRYTFRLEVTDDGGLTDSDDVRIFVSADDNASNTPPTVDAGQDRQIVLPDNEVTFIVFAEDDGLIETVSWEQLMGPAVNLEGIDSDSLHVTNLTMGDYIFEVTVVDDLGAVANDQVALSVVDIGTEPEVPTGASTMKIFSPNGDGQNDLWILDADNAISSNCELTIFNSQGVEVFKAQPYLNDWDGTFNGEELKQGAYFYVLRCGGSSDNQTSGSITLVR